MIIITKGLFVLIGCYLLMMSETFVVDGENNDPLSYHHHFPHRHRHYHLLRKPIDAEDRVKVMIYRRLEHFRTSEPCTTGACTKAPDCLRRPVLHNHTKFRRRCSCNDSTCRYEIKTKRL